MQPRKEDYIPSGPSDSRQVRDLALTYLAEAATIGDRILFQRRMLDLTHSIIGMKNSQSTTQSAAPKPSSSLDYARRLGYQPPPSAFLSPSPPSPPLRSSGDDDLIYLQQRQQWLQTRRMPDARGEESFSSLSLPVHLDESLRMPSSSGLLRLREMRAALQSTIDAGVGVQDLSGVPVASASAEREKIVEQLDSEADHAVTASDEAPQSSAIERNKGSDSSPHCESGAVAPDPTSDLSIGDKVLLLQSFFLGAAKSDRRVDAVDCSVEALKMRLISDKSLKRAVGDSAVMSLLCTIYPLSDDSTLTLSEFMSLALPCCCAAPQGRPADAPKEEVIPPSASTEVNSASRRASEEEVKPALTANPPQHPVVIDAKTLESLGARQVEPNNEQRSYLPNISKSIPEYNRHPANSAVHRAPLVVERVAAANTSPPVKPRAVVTSLDLSGLSAEKIIQLAGGLRK